MTGVYSWVTANGHTLHIMREARGLPYRVIPIGFDGQPCDCAGPSAQRHADC